MHDGKIREKPESGEECRAYLASYAASPACTVRANYPAPGTTGEHFGGQMGHMVTLAVVETTSHAPTHGWLCAWWRLTHLHVTVVQVTSVVVTNTITGHRVHGTDIARQHFRPIPDDVVDKLIAKGDIMYCCGGFMIDDPLLFPYLGEREGDEDSIIGMPLALLRDLISRAEAAAAEAAAGAQAQ